MDAHLFGQLLRTTAAGSLILISNEIVVGEHLVQFEPDRPQVSAACSPIWGYNRPCWRRFPDVPACDQYGCSIAPGYEGTVPSQAVPSQAIYLPQGQAGNATVWTSEGQQLPAVNKPMNVLPGGINPAGNLVVPGGAGGVPAGVVPPGAGATHGVPVVPQPVVPSTDRPLPPLPSPPAATAPLTPVPDPGAQQSRYSPSTIWTPQNSVQTSRYGQIPATTISNRSRPSRFSLREKK